MAATTPVAIIGAGPVGLAAAAHLATRGIPFVVLEAGAEAGAAIREWAHVRLFSPWSYAVDAAARDLLASTGWIAPDPDRYPTGGEIVDAYLAPLAAHPAIAPYLRLRHRVTAVARERADLMRTAGRTRQPYVLRVDTPEGLVELTARAVIDASGTWATPNPIGANGLPAMGEDAVADRTVTGIPDVRGAQRERYAGRRVLVVGSGHSAFNVLQDLVALAAEAPGTTIEWAIRRRTSAHIFGGGANDTLSERGALGQRVARMVADGKIRLHTDTRITRLERAPDGIVARSGEHALPPVDEIVVTTGFRPDLSLLREVRLDLDPAVEAPTALAPLIDPNVHSCGTVRPHGYEELRHPDPDLYIVGMKSYGRAPTFLMMTGYEQVRSIAAALAGDMAAARRVELVLPETGVCSTNRPDDGDAAASCCAPASADTLAADEAACCTPTAASGGCCSTTEPQLISIGSRER
jgi:thioredoxin reductase